MSDTKKGMEFYLRVCRWVDHAKAMGYDTSTVLLHPSDAPYYWLVLAAGIFKGIQFKELGGPYLNTP